MTLGHQGVSGGAGLHGRGNEETAGVAGTSGVARMRLVCGVDGLMGRLKVLRELWRPEGGAGGGVGSDTAEGGSVMAGQLPLVLAETVSRENMNTEGGGLLRGCCGDACSP